MKRDSVAVALGLALLGAAPAVAGAQDQPELAGVAPHRFQIAVIFDVHPAEAVVVIDGRPIGVAKELTAQATSVMPGWHTVEIGAPGFHPYVRHFLAQERDSVNSFVVTLAPE